ncbi:MAG: 50S ribosomal protein L4 [Sandaracinus sp.]|nr:50S ribosomal protein L4 [Sandaracinus sp.]|tara:strand:+ start:1495 stop:2145 length:651 start_codon:yes stop_codon:yes gene_type:complete
MKATVYNLNRESAGEIELDDAIFGAEVNEDLLYEVLKAQLASKRQGTSTVKNRAARRGSSKKIYRQKGTGNARHGSIRAPIFRGGGIAHGPKSRSYAYRPPRKMRAGALRSALSLKAKEGRLTIVDTLELDAIKTKALAAVFGRLEVGTSAVVVDDLSNENLRLSARNLATHLVLPPEGVNLYDLLRHEHLVLTKSAVEALQARFAKKNGAAQGED